MNAAGKKFAELLDRLDVRPGDVIFQHASFKRLAYLGLSPAELLDALLQRLGPAGTLAMPTFVWNLDRTGRPWKGYADFFRMRPVFDVRHTPTNFGIIPELFRRMPGVHRSVNGWTICSRGRLAAEVTDGQELMSHPFGPGSSFDLLHKHGVKVLGLGCSLNTSSLGLILDYQLGDEHPHQVFTAETLPYVVIDHGGRRIETHSHWMLPEASRVIKPSVIWELSPRLREATHRADEGDTIHFCYPFAVYHDEALPLGRAACRSGSPVPWLRDYPLRPRPNAAADRKSA